MPMALILLQKRSCSHPELGLLPARMQCTGKARNLPEVFRLLEKKASEDLRKLKKIIKKVDQHPQLTGSPVNQSASYHPDCGSPHQYTPHG